MTPSPLGSPVPDASKILAELSSCIQCDEGRDVLARRAVEAIHAALPQAGWTGIYWLEGDELHLGPYIGPPTDHVRIPVGTGVCGTAVAEDKDQVVADVRTRENYLACTAATRSEIVVLIRSGGKVLGQTRPRQRQGRRVLPRRPRLPPHGRRRAGLAAPARPGRAARCDGRGRPEGVAAPSGVDRPAGRRRGPRAAHHTGSAWLSWMRMRSPIHASTAHAIAYGIHGSS